MFDEEPDGDPHGECALEIKRLGELVTGYRKILWVLARNAGLSLHVPMLDLNTIPDDAELLSWHEPIFDAMILKGLCGHADCDPKMNAARLDVP
jgi:hypothetical protein